MSAPLDDLGSYSAYVYTLSARHPFVTGSTLALAPVGATLAKLEGRIECPGGIHLEVWELVDFAQRRIRTYSYEVYRQGEKVCWYDPWEHPEISALAPRSRITSISGRISATIVWPRRESALTRRTSTHCWRMSAGIGLPGPEVCRTTGLARTWSKPSRVKFSSDP